MKICDLGSGIWDPYSKTSLGTERSKRKRPLSSQVSCLVHPIMWNIADLAASSTHIFRGNLFSETFLNYFFKRCNIVFLESGILEEFTFQGEGSALSLASINRQRQPWSTKGQTNLVMAILTLHHPVFHNVHEIQIFATHSSAVIQTRIGKVRTRHAHRMDVNGFGEVTGRRDISWLCSCWAIDYPTELHLLA